MLRLVSMELYQEESTIIFEFNFSYFEPISRSVVLLSFRSPFLSSSYCKNTTSRGGKGHKTSLTPSVLNVQAARSGSSFAGGEGRPRIVKLIIAFSICPSLVLCLCYQIFVPQPCCFCSRSVGLFAEEQPVARSRVSTLVCISGSALKEVCTLHQVIIRSWPYLLALGTPLNSRRILW